MTKQQVSGQEVLPVVSFERIAETVDVRARAAELITSLQLLDHASTVELVLSGIKYPSRKNPDSYRSERSYIEQYQRSSTENLLGARDSFHHAYQIGHNRPVPKQDKDFLAAWGAFYMAYKGPAQKDKREAQIAKYSELIKIEGERPQGDVYYETPNAELLDRPVQVQPVIANKKPARERKKELTTRQKLEVLRDDPHAGFLPATHREKNYATALLDYVKNPRSRAATASQLQEIFVHQAKPKLFGDKFNPTKGKIALKSVTYEMGDYLVQSTRQMIALERLDQLVEACPNPSVTLLEQAGKAHEAYGPLVRYIDLLALRERGTLMPGFEPLITLENRDTRDFQDKHKTVEDVYTSPLARDDVINRISQTVSILTIGEARQLVKDAATNEAHRADFWQSRLTEVMRHGAVRHVAQSVLAKADRIRRHAQVS